MTTIHARHCMGAAILTLTICTFGCDEAERSDYSVEPSSSTAQDATSETGGNSAIADTRTVDADEFKFPTVAECVVHSLESDAIDQGSSDDRIVILKLDEDPSGIRLRARLHPAEGHDDESFDTCISRRAQDAAIEMPDSGFAPLTMRISRSESNTDVYHVGPIPRVKGTMSHEQFRLYTYAFRPAFNQCTLKGFEDLPRQGAALLGGTITSDGTLANTRFVAKTFHDDEVEECLLETFDWLIFPPADGETVLRYPTSYRFVGEAERIKVRGVRPPKETGEEEVDEGDTHQRSPKTGPPGQSGPK